MINLKYSGQTLNITDGFAGLTAEQIKAADEYGQKHNIALWQSVLKLGILTEYEMLKASSKELGVEFLNPADIVIEAEAIAMMNANTASFYNIVPVRNNNGRLVTATANPCFGEIKNEIEIVLETSAEVEFVLALSEEIKKAIRKCYGLGAATVEQMVNGDNIIQTTEEKKDLLEENQANDASVIKLVNQILADAIGSGTTDIHIEPYEHQLRARYRIDGMLQETLLPATVKYFREGITSRIKIISGLDIAEKRLPQDGRSQVVLGGKKYDLRISILPSKYGEAINIRILPQGELIADLPALGMPEDVVRKLSGLISKPHGIILVTGPTGSGKTTTLYTCMNMLKDSDRKIITIEDPIEYDMPGLVQMQTHAEIGFTFSRALRSMLRHDPDIMLVGEIRDLETAETAIRTALTGHLVFSTLHTNDAASAITRLLDMGIEAFLAASSIEAILAQRLVRVICKHCKDIYEPDEETSTAVSTLLGIKKIPQGFGGKGCVKCRFSGYSGRTVITELLLMSAKIREMTVERRHAGDIDSQARREGMMSLFEAGIKKVEAGITTYQEVLRVTKGAVGVDY